MTNYKSRIIARQACDEAKMPEYRKSKKIRPENNCN